MEISLKKELMKNEEGTHEELLKNPESKYSQLWNIQCK